MSARGAAVSARAKLLAFVGAEEAPLGLATADWKRHRRTVFRLLEALLKEHEAAAYSRGYADGHEDQMQMRIRDEQERRAAVAGERRKQPARARSDD